MTKHAARPASRRRNRTLMLTVPLVALALWSWGIDAAQAAEPGKDATAASLPRILVLATGGTIAGQADARATGAYKSGQITGEQLMQSVPGLDKLAKLNAEQISSIGSQDMNDKVWFALARRIQDAFDKNEADGILITHGTDTLEETAFFLDNVVRRRQAGGDRRFDAPGHGGECGRPRQSVRSGAGGGRSALSRPWRDGRAERQDPKRPLDHQDQHHEHRDVQLPQ